MTTPQGYTPLPRSEHSQPEGHTMLQATAGNELVTTTLILRRRLDGKKIRELSEFPDDSLATGLPASREEFIEAHGASPDDLKLVSKFAGSHGLEVVEKHPARRSVVVRGTVEAINRAFGIELHDYQSPRGKYRGFSGPAHVPAQLQGVVEAIFGLDNRKIPAKHYSTANGKAASDPPNTKPLTPQQVAALYGFPDGDGSDQTIGIYEMVTQDETGAVINPGYALEDLTRTMNAFGGGLTAPKLINVSVDGVTNSGVSDVETGLDITVASAIAQKATIAVYFTGGEAQNILHALQAMIHPAGNDPVPTVISISYGWGPDDASADSFSEAQYEQLGQLFQDAANLSITVLVSSGDSGAFVGSKTQAQTSYPATEPWVIACGGTTIGNINGATFDEYVWNDISGHKPGASGGGVSPRFDPPKYQDNANVPKNLISNEPGRGIPDIAGNASVNSGYTQFISGKRTLVGGTSAVAPLYAGLIARINAKLGRSVGFINPVLYSLSGSAFRDITSPPGPANNSFGRVTGYPAGPGWDACTGLGSVKGTALQDGLQAALAGQKEPALAGD